MFQLLFSGCKTIKYLEIWFQAGPLENVRIPKDKDTGKQRSYGFVVYQDVCSVRFACELFNSLNLFGRPINCKPQNSPAESQSPRHNQTLSPHQNPSRSPHQLERCMSSPGRSPTEDYRHQNGDRRPPARNRDSYPNKDLNSYHGNGNKINFNLQRTSSLGGMPPRINPLLAQTLFNQHMQNNQLRYGGSPSAPQGPMRRHNTMYERRPATSRIQRRHQSHPY